MNAPRSATVACDAREHFTAGGNCAESVFSSLAETPGVPPVPPALGSGFTLGVGHTGCVCGALVAGVTVLSASVAEEGLEPIAQREAAEKLAAEFADRFKTRWNSTCCRVIKRGTTEGSNEAAALCAGITEFSAELVAEMLAEKTRATRRWSGRDVVSGMRRAAVDVLAATAIGFVLAAIAPGALSATVALAAGVLGLALGAGIEFASLPARRIGRALRASGTIAAALLALVVVFAPAELSPLVDGLLGKSAGSAAIVARGLAALAAAIVAGLSLYEYRRFK